MSDAKDGDVHVDNDKVGKQSNGSSKQDSETSENIDGGSLVGQTAEDHLPVSERRRWGLFGFSFITISLTAGLVYGWPALRRNVLLETDMSERTLGGIFTAGAWSTQGGRFLFGVGRDRFGTRSTTGIALGSVMLGSIGVALCDGNSIVLGISIFAMGLGSGAQLCLQPVAGLFPTRSGTVLASLSGAFQISGLVFLVLTSISDDRRYTFGAFSLLIFVLGIAACFILPRGSSFLPEGKASSNDDDAESLESFAEDGSHPSVPAPFVTALDQMKSLEYVTLIAWFSVCVLPLQFYVGSIGFQLENRGDDDGFYTSLFSIIYAGAAILAPVGGNLSDRFGLGVTQGMATLLTAVSFLLLGFNSISLQVHVVGLVCYSVGRLFIFGMYFSNIGKRFEYANFGTLAGLGLLISAVVSLLQYPLIAVAADSHDQTVDWACAGALVLILPYCAWLSRQERQSRYPTTSFASSVKSLRNSLS
uniref:Major facilitator superfamily (MFS) profile domain-containing protein n=1 Tax=Attheya septentrionalis TaxID=420275 RepID=A0A7S2UQL5_9STRA|mmetsp:Transcript_833/g.1537  ORF Transcript_833/g.1537 Transcript_833/m.1537 type:complete len:476 (+) Transcript_833:94-1521(+)